MQEIPRGFNLAFSFDIYNESITISSFSMFHNFFFKPCKCFGTQLLSSALSYHHFTIPALTVQPGRHRLNPPSAELRIRRLTVKLWQTSNCIPTTPPSIMNSLRIARAAVRARPAAIARPIQRRGYAEVASDKIKLSLALPHQVRIARSPKHEISWTKSAGEEREEADKKNLVRVQVARCVRLLRSYPNPHHESAVTDRRRETVYRSTLPLRLVIWVFWLVTFPRSSN